MGRVLDYILNHKKRMLKFVLIIVCIIVIIMFGAFQYLITLDDGIENDADPKNVPSTVKNYLAESALDGYLDNARDLKTKPSKSGGYALDVDLDEITDNIIKALNEYDGRLNIYLSKGNMHEYLKKMIKAQYITQYPDLRSADKIGTEVPEGEFQGVIQFNRHKSDGEEQLLEYIPLGEEDSVSQDTLYGLINKANSEKSTSEDVIKSTRDKLLRYFSVDPQGNLIVVNWSEIITKNAKGEYEVEYPGRSTEVDYLEKDMEYLNDAEQEITYEYFAHSINYKSSMSKYTMPFNYLWAFLVCGRDEEFISDFADLVLDSKIVISIYDNLTEMEETTIDAYNDNRWEQVKNAKRTVIGGHVTAFSEGPWNDPELVSTMHKYEINYTKTYTNSIDISVTDLDIWYMQYLVSYTYEVEDTGEEKETEHLDPIDNDPVYVEGEWRTVNQEEDSEEDKQEKTDLIVQNVYTQRTFTNIYRCIMYKYTLNGDPQVKEKTDPKLKEGDEGYPNFCTLYLNSQAAMRNINGVESWLFTIIENNSDTTNMLELTKYMLYCALGTDFGVKSFDFDNLYPTLEVGDLYGDTIEEQIWFALLDAGYSKEAAAGVLGNLKQESGIRTNNLQNSYESVLHMNDEQYTQAVDSGTYTKFINDGCGYGLAQWTSSGRKQGLYNFAKNIRGVSISDQSMQIEYLLGEISPSGGAEGYAKFQMGSPRDGYTYSSWTNASTPEDAAVAFCKVFERAGVESLSNRKKYAREFYDKYQNLSKSSTYIGDIPLTGENKQRMFNLLNDAVRIANDDRYGYSQEKRDEEFYYDCSSLVRRLYQKHFNISVPNTTADYPKYERYKVGPAKGVSLQPGDVLWRRRGSEGHVVIYIGNGNYVAAHSAKRPKASQITVYQDNPANYMDVYRFIGN